MATAAQLRLRPADNGRALTLDEFREADEEEGHRYELAGGVLEVTEVPNDPHGGVVCNLYRALAQYWRIHPGAIHRFGGASEFRLWIPAMISGRNPDVAVVLRNAPKDVRGRRVPALAVEVVSASGETRDYVTKREEYLVYGLFEYWIVDPGAKTVTVLLRDGGAWVERAYKEDQPVESLVLPGFGVTVAELLAGAEEDDGASA